MPDRTYKNTFGDGETTYHEDGSTSRTYTNLDSSQTTYHSDGSTSRTYDSFFGDHKVTYNSDGSTDRTYNSFFGDHEVTYHGDGSTSRTYDSFFGDHKVTYHDNHGSSSSSSSGSGSGGSSYGGYGNSGSGSSSSYSSGGSSGSIFSGYGEYGSYYSGGSSSSYTPTLKDRIAEPFENMDTTFGALNVFLLMAAFAAFFVGITYHAQFATAMASLLVTISIASFASSKDGLHFLQPLAALFMFFSMTQGTWALMNLLYADDAEWLATCLWVAIGVVAVILIMHAWVSEHTALIIFPFAALSWWGARAVQTADFWYTVVFYTMVVATVLALLMVALLAYAWWDDDVQGSERKRREDPFEDNSKIEDFFWGSIKGNGALFGWGCMFVIVPSIVVAFGLVTSPVVGGVLTVVMAIAHFAAGSKTASRITETWPKARLNAGAICAPFLLSFAAFLAVYGNSYEVATLGATYITYPVDALNGWISVFANPYYYTVQLLDIIPETLLADTTWINYYGGMLPLFSALFYFIIMAVATTAGIYSGEKS